jgi:hypothetical protein
MKNKFDETKTVEAGNPNRRGRLTTVDLLLLTSSAAFHPETIFFSFFTK